MKQDLLECRKNPDLWFSDSSKVKEQVKIICNTCFFKETCLNIGRSNNEIHGIWGGVDLSNKEERERTSTSSFIESIPRCRAGLHPKPEGPRCLPCKKLADKRYESSSRKKRVYVKSTRPRKHIRGGYCVNGHLLSDDNIIVRSNDQALLCKKCTSMNKRSRKAYSKVGDFSA